jgi:hypothetical protein
MSLIESKQTAIGLIALEYQVALYNDVQVSGSGSVTQPSNQQFIVNCTQRILLSNDAFKSLVPSDPAVQSYLTYPALFQLTFQFSNASGGSGLTFNLLDYSPQAVNTTVQQSGSNSDSTTAGKSSSTSTTTGTQNWQSSTYSTGVDSFSGGVLGLSLQYGSESGYSKSSGSSTSNSNTTDSGSSNSSSDSVSSSSSMSVKNWGAYSWVDPTSTFPTWVFGQEYPWNAIQCRFGNGGTPLGSTSTGVELELETKNPAYTQVPMYVSLSMVDNLWDGTFLYPPSELSMFGLNFVTKATWRVYVDFDTSTQITITNPITYFSASHIPPTKDSEVTTTVYMDPAATSLYVYDADKKAYVDPSVTVDLNFMALSPIGQNASAAIIGFTPNKFIPPIVLSSDSGSATAPLGFKTIAATNDLLVQDTTQNTTTYPSGGTSGYTLSENCLTSTWDSKHQFPYQITLYFKIIDSVKGYTLYMKHWIAQSTNVMITIVVNGDPATEMTKYVTALEAQGGEDNILSIALRDLNFASISYHDYLQLGLNSVTITMEPSVTTTSESVDQLWSNCGYQVRAIAVRQD